MTLLNAADVVLARAARLGDKVAIVHYPSGETTYREFGRLIGRSANALAALGLGRGDRVCLLLADSPLACAMFLGAIKLGAVAIPLNPRLSTRDYAHVFADSGATLCIADAEYRAALEQARRAAPAVRLIGSEGETSFAQCAADAADHAATVPTAASDPAFWLYSSGTTGRPKGIIHTHANCARSGMLLRDVIRADESDVILATSKLFFAYALDNAFLGALSIGATTILNAGWPEPEQVVAQIARHRPTVFFTVPTLIRRLLGLGAERLRPLKAVRAIYTGGERIPDAVYRQWLDTVGVEVRECYGLSETYCNALANPLERNRPGSCGLPVHGVETRLVDPLTGGPARDELGVLWLKHPALAAGYTDPAATARAFRDGWFCTNDLFRVDRDGYFWHQGRADELLKVAGQWVKPAEVEEAVLGGQSVREAACVVVADADGFERLALFVVPGSAPTDALEAHVREQCATKLPRHSQPKWIREIAELPRTPTGKVQRFMLRESLTAELQKTG
jgi:benzoate-CoA ligase